MNVMQKFTLKSLVLNKKRTIVTIIGVIISAAMITAVATFVTSFLDTLQRDCIAGDGNWHAAIESVSTENVKAISENEEVADSFLRRAVGYGFLDGSQNNQKPYLYIEEYSPEGFLQMFIRPTSGRLPQKSGEIILSDTVAKSCGVHFALGDTLTISLGKRVNNDGYEITRNPDLCIDYGETGNDYNINERLDLQKTVSYTIVGTMDRPPFENSWSAGCGAIGYIDESTLAPGDTVDVYFTVKKLDRSIFDRVPILAQQAGKEAEDTNLHVGLLRYYGLVKDDNLYNFLIGFALIITIIIIIASVALIYNAFAISVSERAKQLGLLASVGATKNQKRASVMFEGIIIGAIGIPLGILSGVGGMAVTLKAINPLLENYVMQSSGIGLTLAISPLFLVSAALFSVLTIFISSYIPAKRASRITPIDAIRQTKEVYITRRNLKVPRLVRKVFGFEAEIALKNLKRSRKKYRATILSLIISIVLFLTVSTYIQMTDFLSGASYEGYNYDLEVRYSNRLTNAQIADTNKMIESLEDVSTCATIRKLSVSTTIDAGLLSPNAEFFIGYQADETGMLIFYVDIVSMDDESFLKYVKSLKADVATFHDTTNPAGIFINYAQSTMIQPDYSRVKAAGEILNISNGHVFTLSPKNDGNAFTAPATDITIKRITDKRPMGITTQNYYDSCIIVSSSVYEQIASALSDDPVSQITKNALYITTEDDLRLEKQISEILENLPPTDMINIKSAYQGERNLQTFVAVFIYGFLTLISLICIANIFNTVTTNIALRRKEFAMLRSVGMTPSGFSKMVRFESIFYGLKGLLYGLPISIGIGLLLNQMQQSILVSGISLPWYSYGIVVVMILVIVFATMLYSTARIKRENIIDALKEENM